jgi:MFS family permease
MLKKLYSGWNIVAAAWGIHIIIAGTYVLGLGVLFNPIRNEMAWSATVTALAFSLRQFETGFLSPVVGFLVDKFGARKMVFTGIFILGLGFLLLGQIQNLWQFYVVFLFLSIGPSIGYAQPLNATIVKWFSTNRVRAMSLMWTGGAIGSLIVPGIALLVERSGWRWTTTVCGLLVWFIGIPLATFIRNAPPEQRDGLVGKDNKIITGDKDSYGVRNAIATRMFWTIGLAQASFSFCSSMALTVNLIPYLETLSIPRIQAASMVTVVMMSAGCMRILLSIVGDKYHPRNILAFLYFLCACGILILSLAQNYWQAIPFAILYGIAHGGSTILVATFVSLLFGTKKFASISGVLQTFGIAGGVLGPIVGGMMFDNFGTYRPAYVIGVFMMAIAIPLILSAKPKDIERENING